MMLGEKAVGDAYLIDRQRVYTLDGTEYYTLRSVTRHGRRLRLAGGKSVAVSDDMVFIPSGSLPDTVVHMGSHLLIPVDEADGSNLEIVPWQDLPERAKRSSRSDRSVQDSARGQRPASRLHEPVRRWTVVAEWPQLWAALAPSGDPEPAPETPKVTLLRLAIDLASGKDADRALMDVFEASLEAGIPQIAIAAIKKMRGSGGWPWIFPRTINEFLKDRTRWLYLDQQTARRWEERLVAGTEWDEARSRALARLGFRRLTRGEISAGLELWNAAPEGRPIDELISEVALECAQLGWLEWALTVAGAIHDRSVKASAFAQLARYVY